VLASTDQQLNISVYVHTVGFIHTREKVSFSGSEKEMHCKCEIRTVVCLKCGHLGYDTVKFGKMWLPAFQRNILPTPSGLNTALLGRWLGKLTEGRKEHSILHDPFSFSHF
jgi:hypothetical protein